MSTCCTVRIVRIVDEHDTTYYVSRGHDGNPGRVRADLDRVIAETTKTAIFADDPLGRVFLGVFLGRWSGSEIGLFVPLIFAVLNDPKCRIPPYELLTGWRGDESYRLELRWFGGRWCWEAL